MSVPILSVVMPTFRDYNGVWPTVIDLHRERIRLGLLQEIEIVVADNDPDGPHSKRDPGDLRPSVPGFVAGIPNAKYVAVRGVQGTAAAKNAAIAAASGRYASCADSHVFFNTGVLERKFRFWTERGWEAFGGSEFDFYQGPNLHGRLINDDGTPSLVGSHFRGAWGTDGMYGQWAIAESAKDPAAMPIRILSGGCGFFMVAKSGWPGFHAKSRGFGGEESYIHAKYRSLGREARCLPWAQWIHRYGYVDGVPHNTGWLDRCWNYLIGYAELGPNHGYPDLAGIKAAHLQGGRVTQSQWEQLCREAGVRPPPPMLPPAADARQPAAQAPQRPGTLKPISAIEATMEEQLPCRHRGRVSGSLMCNVGCPSMQSELVTIWDCKKHGACTVSSRRSDIRCCTRCDDRTD